MQDFQWGVMRAVARSQVLDGVSVALIVDSPWIPGFLGISTKDYCLDTEVWLDANLKVQDRFPGAIFVPGLWAEVGMAAEPSGFGCEISLPDSSPPSVRPLGRSLEETAALRQPNPRTDGLMPRLISRYRDVLPRLAARGERIRIVAARGPLALAAHLLGVTEFLVGLKTEPEATARLLRLTTDTIKSWLEAQAEVLPDADGILILDDVVGFLSEQDYLEHAHPYLKEIFSVSCAVKVFHNDTDNPASYRHMADLGVQIFNFTHLRDIATVRGLVGDDVALMGNVPPLDSLVREGPDQVHARATGCLRANGRWPGFLLSAGGGVSPGTPAAAIDALIKAAEDFDRAG